MKRWFLAGGTVAVVLMLATFNPDMPIINGNDAKLSDVNKKDVNQQHHDHDHHGKSHPDSKATSPQGPFKSPSNDAHFEQLSPEMKQALRETLLLNGPMKTYTRPDGAIVLPSNGRTTQMPVAVQMPDGSIQIREYQYIPDDQ